MRVQLLFAPPKSGIKLSDLLEKVYPPLGILYIAGYLRKHMPGVELKVTDGLLEGWERSLSEIRAFRPDLLFVSYITPCASSAYELVKEAKAFYPGLATVFGGPHATALPLEPFESSSADFVIAGEGEETAVELVRAVQSGEKEFGGIDGLYWMKEGRVVGNNPRRFIRNLDDIPFPARDLINLREYHGWFVHRRTPETSILFSRGCPYDCTFCTNAVWKSSKPWLRLRSPRSIADEMEALKSLGIREVFDTSDEFNSDVTHAIAVCEEIKRRRLNMPWKSQVRAMPLTEELVRAMAESGCWYVHLGIESGNERTLNGIKKFITLEQVKNACALLKKYRIKVFGLFMLFNVWEEKGELAFEGIRESYKTLDFAKRLIDEKLLDYMSCTITTPYPGSQLFDTARKFSLIKEDLRRDWGKWLKEEDFIINLPGVDYKEAARVYFKGSLLRSYCYLRSGNWSLKEIPLFLNKAIRAVQMWANSFRSY